MSLGYQPRAVTDRTREANKRKFLNLLRRNGGHVNRTIQAMHMGRSTLFDWRENDPTFAAAYDETLDLCIEALEAEARRRAEGYEEPVVYQGKIMGHWVDPRGRICKEGTAGAVMVPTTVTKFSDQLLMFLLKAHRPEKYRDNFPATKGRFSDMTDRELDEQIAEHIARKAGKRIDTTSRAVN